MVHQRGHVLQKRHHNAWYEFIRDSFLYQVLTFLGVRHRYICSCKYINTKQSEFSIQVQGYDDFVYSAWTEMVTVECFFVVVERSRSGYWLRFLFEKLCSDLSGSMLGQRYEIAKQTTEAILETLSHNDYFNIMAVIFVKLLKNLNSFLVLAIFSLFWSKTLFIKHTGIRLPKDKLRKVFRVINLKFKIFICSKNQQRKVNKT